jgi:hypothetical protein
MAVGYLSQALARAPGAAAPAMPSVRPTQPSHSPLAEEDQRLNLATEDNPDAGLAVEEPALPEAPPPPDPVAAPEPDPAPAAGRAAPQLPETAADEGETTAPGEPEYRGDAFADAARPAEGVPASEPAPAVEPDPKPAPPAPRRPPTEDPMAQVAAALAAAERWVAGDEPEAPVKEAPAPPPEAPAEASRERPTRFATARAYEPPVPAPIREVSSPAEPPAPPPPRVEIGGIEVEILPPPAAPEPRRPFRALPSRTPRPAAPFGWRQR